MFKRFEQACGLRLNLDKSEILILGKNKNDYTPMARYGLKWPKEPLKALGQWVSNDEISMQTLNEEECISRVKDACNRLKGLKISLKARTYLINTKIIY